LGGTNYFPENQGFDLNIAGGERGSPPSYFSPYRIPTLRDGPKGEYLTDPLTDEALKFIEGAGGKPFLLYLSHYAVHIPLQAKPELLAKYQAKAARLPPPTGPEFRKEGKSQIRQAQNNPVYAAMVQSLDESVGRVMQKLAGLPLRPHQHMDGVSLAPLLKGDMRPERSLFWHYPHYSNQGGAPDGAVSRATRARGYADRTATGGLTRVKDAVSVNLQPRIPLEAVRRARVPHRHANREGVGAPSAGSESDSRPATVTSGPGC
jgi:hypothetical protein